MQRPFTNSVKLLAEPDCFFQGHVGSAYDVKFYGDGEDALLRVVAMMVGFEDGEIASSNDAVSSQVLSERDQLYFECIAWGKTYDDELFALLILVHFIERVYSLLGEKIRRKKVVVTFEVSCCSDPPVEAEMLAIFKDNLVNPPEELNSPASLDSSTKSKKSNEILHHFMSSNPSNGFSMSFGNGDALLAYSKPSNHHGMFCGLNNIYCAFLGSLNNLSMLIKQYGLSKGTNEALFIIEAYRTLRDRGPYPADQVLKELEGSFGFVIYDESGTVFAASGSNGQIGLFWGIAADGSVVISDSLELIKASCAKSFAPFPTGCMFHSGHGLMSYEHPNRKLKAMPRIDSEGAMCGANFLVDSQSRKSMMPRVGSEANWASWGSQA